MLPKKLQAKLDRRKADLSFRALKAKPNLVDFSSNDYLGFAKSEFQEAEIALILKDFQNIHHGATGSRLLSGQSALFEATELQIAKHHKVEAALIFNSGYDANLGVLSSVLQRGDIVFFDELCHASIRDGIRMSNAKAIKFKHNDLKDLNKKIKREKQKESKSHAEPVEAYIITESVFSMDGDVPDLKELAHLSKTYNANLIMDEAHALGVMGENGEGLIQKYNLEKDIFARVVTYGKALGGHGAAILGSQDLKDYLINYSRPFIFSTALSPHSIARITSGYDALSKLDQPNSTLKHLQKNIGFFKTEVEKQQLQSRFILSESAIQSCIISGNEHVKSVSKYLEEHGFDVRAILSPTVPEGQERLRFCLHSYNSVTEISKVLQHLATFTTHGR